MKPTVDAKLRAMWVRTFEPAPVRLYAGPVNSAGQAWEWVRAAERAGGVSGLNLYAPGPGARGSFRYSADHLIDTSTQFGDLSIHAARILAGATHVLFETGKPVLGRFHTASMNRDVPRLLDAGIAVAAICHGSEVRDPLEHRERYPYSPFRDPTAPATASLIDSVARHRRELERFPGQTFVSTPDQLDFVPDATWLPLVVDLERFYPGPPVLERVRPVVLHAPSNPWLKGTSVIDAVMRELDARGWITYQHLEGVPNAGMADFLRGADIVIDQIALGSTGVLAAESQAAGRLVLGHLTADVRARLGGDVPVVETNPDNIRTVIESILDDRVLHTAVAARGPAYAREHHDGRRAAAALAPFLGLGPGATDLS
jgi:hypothetical protein